MALVDSNCFSTQGSKSVFVLLFDFENGTISDATSFRYSDIGCVSFRGFDPGDGSGPNVEGGLQSRSSHGIL